MKRHAIFVDAGYVFAQGSVSLSGSKTPRSQLKLDANEIIAQLTTLALAKSPGVPLLRIYWYDGAGNRPTTEHLLLANSDNVKLRLGSINSAGEQKEVDSLLVTDLIDLARNQSICDATVVTADGCPHRRANRADFWSPRSFDRPGAEPRLSITVSSARS
jgi:hypothetical protein